MSSKKPVTVSVIVTGPSLMLSQYQPCSPSNGATSEPVDFGRAFLVLAIAHEEILAGGGVVAVQVAVDEAAVGFPGVHDDLARAQHGLDLGFLVRARASSSSCAFGSAGLRTGARPGFGSGTGSLNAGISTSRTRSLPPSTSLTSIVRDGGALSSVRPSARPMPVGSMPYSAGSTATTSTMAATTSATTTLSANALTGRRLPAR